MGTVIASSPEADFCSVFYVDCQFLTNSIYEQRISAFVRSYHIDIGELYLNEPSQVISVYSNQKHLILHEVHLYKVSNEHII